MRHYARLSVLLLIPQVLYAQDVPKYAVPAEVKASFKKLLDRPKVPFDVKVVSSKNDAAGHGHLRFTMASEKKADGSIERIPIYIRFPPDTKQRFPAVIVLHGTGGSINNQGVMSFMEDLNKR